jgi:uncharacterized protein YegL
MPSQILNTLDTPNNYGFSAAKIEDLKASEFTLVTIVQDISGSVAGFKQGMIACLKTALESCKTSQRSENLLVRLVGVNGHVNELHGFRLLSDIQPSEYDTILDRIGGNTALYDGAHTAIDATIAYARKLTDQGIDNNAVVYIITDGEDNASNFSPADVQRLIFEARQEEVTESLLTVLIGVNTQGSITSYLTRFKDEAGLDRYVDLADASKNTLAKLGAFISRSISSQSQSLGTGKSSALTF